MTATTTTTTSPPKSLSLGMRLQTGPVRLFLASQFCAKIEPVALSPTTSLAGKSAIITGGASGIGYHASRQLLGLGLSRLILAVRSPEKAESVTEQFRKEFPSSKIKIEIWQLEMTSYASIQAFSRRVKSEAPDVDIVILNAGVTHMNFEVNAETGHERVVQVNYLSTVLLAVLLLPTLTAAAAQKQQQQQQQHDGKKQQQLKRLTIVGSGVAYMTKIPNREKRPFLASFDDLKVQAWDPSERYCTSKALLHLFLVQLLEYLPSADNTGVVVNIVCPGYCKGSGLHRDSEGVMGMLLAASKSLTGRTPEEGAMSYVDAVVVKGKESHVCFLLDCKVMPFMNMVYTSEGETLMNVLWDETMAELEFAGARGILEGLRK
ncbi:hypothetical protein QBC37DRAFT_429934 [Rhypophila decipiens]|uniref:Uncharacterized protein n=1 Tax=Rhypophila decipiens TaxID=261697 RepID=A0AAN7B4I6_9PEZI|nr:hypothetical protein QBC37DRAFT_429934 [Rhypophila decipiens]